MRDVHGFQIGGLTFAGATVDADALTLRGIGFSQGSFYGRFEWSLELEAPLAEAAPTPRLAVEGSLPVDWSLSVRDPEIQDYVRAYKLPTLNSGDGTSSITFTLRNEGRKVLNVSSILMVGPQAGFFSVNAPALPLVLAPAQSQTIQVIYGAALPVGGEHAAFLRIASDDPVSSAHISRVQGSRVHDDAQDLPFAISVMDGTRRLTGESGVDFGVTNAGSSLTRTLSFQNVSQIYAEPLPYQNVTFSIFGAQEGSFSLATTASSKLLPNQKVSRVVRFHPSTSGVHFAWLKIEFEAGQQWIPLTGIVQASGPPVIVGLLPSQIIDASKLTNVEPLSWARSFGVHVVSGSAPMKYQWWKNGARIAGATGTSLSFTKMKATDAGSYSFSATNAQGQTTHTPVSHIAVIAPERFGWIVEGKPFEWNLPHGKPPGCSLGFLWRNYHDEPWPAGFSGMATSKLRTENARFPMPSNVLLCDVTLTMPGGQTLKHEFMHDDERKATPSRWPGRINLPIALVGSPVTADLPRFDPVTQPFYEASLHLVTFSATGLPPGIALNGKTGRLSGTPTAAKIVKGVVEPYEVKITAKCSFPVATETQTVPWMIRPLPTEITGSFEGVYADNLVVLDVLSTGRLSGSMSIFGKKSPFSGRLTVALGAEGEVVVSPVTLTTTGSPRLTYVDPGPVSFWNISFDGSPPEDGDRGKLFRCHVSTRQPYPGPRGPFHVGLLNVYPGYHGSGFATLKISASGAGTWAGTLTDGETFTASQRVVSMPVYDSDSNSWSVAFGIAMHSSLPAKRVMAPAAQLKPDGLIEGSDGTFTTSKTRSSNYGTLRLLGAPYVAPAKGQMWPGFANAAANASLSLSVSEGDAWDGSFTFGLSPTGAVKLPVFGATDPKFSITVTPSTGRVSGTVTVSIPDPDSPPGQTRRLTRSGPFAGMFIPHPEINKVIGHVNLPEYPTPEVPASKTMIRSGPMELKPTVVP